MGIYGNRNIFDLGCLFLPFFFVSEVVGSHVRCVLVVLGFVFSFVGLVFLVLGDYQTCWELVFHLLFARFLGEGFAANSGANKLRFVRLACGANFVVVFFTEARRKKKNTSRHFSFSFLMLCRSVNSAISREAQIFALSPTVNRHHFLLRKIYSTTRTTIRQHPPPPPPTVELTTTGQP